MRAHEPDDHHWLALPTAPFALLVPNLPTILPSSFVRPDRCASTGRLVLRPATTHAFRPNFCRRWTCPVCYLPRVHQLIERVAFHLSHLEREQCVYLTELPRDHTLLTQLRGRAARYPEHVGRLVIARESAPTIVLCSRPLLPLSIAPALPPVTALDALVQLISNPATHPVRVAWSGIWADDDWPPDPSLSILKASDQPLALLIFRMGMEAACERFRVGSWALSDPVPAAVDLRWWVDELRAIGNKLGEE